MRLKQHFLLDCLDSRMNGLWWGVWWGVKLYLCTPMD